MKNKLKEVYEREIEGYTFKRIEKKIMVTEPHDIEKALKVLEDAKIMLEQESVNDRDFLNKYTTITKDNLYFQLNKVQFPILFPLASMMKYGAKDLVNRLLESLKERVNEELIIVVVEPE